jgi:hypothetical protein
VVETRLNGLLDYHTTTGSQLRARSEQLAKHGAVARRTHIAIVVVTTVSAIPVIVIVVGIIVIIVVGIVIVVVASIVVIILEGHASKGAGRRGEGE